MLYLKAQSCRDRSKRIVLPATIVLVMVVCCSFTCIVCGSDSSDAAENKLIMSGKCGDKLNWAFDKETHHLSITGSGQFYNSPDLSFWYYPIETVSLPDGVEEIPDGLFKRCELIKQIPLPSSVKVIGESAFADCTSLESITLPDSLEKIGSRAFESCTSLVTITLPHSLKSIEMNAFCSCYKLFEVINLSSLHVVKGSNSCGQVAYYASNVFSSIEDKTVDITADGYIYGIHEDKAFLLGYSGTSINLTLPETLAGMSYELYDYAFVKSDLVSIVVPKSVTRIGPHAFDSCSRLFEVINLSDIPMSKGSSGNGGISYLAKNLFSSLDDITISQTTDGFVYGICDDKSFLLAYVGQSTNPILPADLGGYGYSLHCRSFVDSKIHAITIPDTVTEIGDFSFSNCWSLDSITIANGVKAIGDYAFSYCTSLASVTIPDSVTSFGGYVFYRCVSLTSVRLSDSMTSLGDYSFKDCASLTSVTIPDSVTSIGDYAFSDCLFLASVTIPDSVTSIGGYAFYRCESLTSVTIPDSVTSIRGHAFYGCESLTSISIPDSVTEIGYGVFSYCKSLETVAIGSGVGNLYLDSFYRCDSLSRISVSEDNPSYSSEQGVLYNKSMTEIMLYPSSRDDSSFTIPNTVGRIGQDTFYGCSTLKDLIIPDSVNDIELFSLVWVRDSIEVSENNPVFSSEDGCLYNKSGTELIFCPSGVKTYTSPEGLAVIRSHAFSIDIKEDGDYYRDYVNYICGYSCSLNTLVLGESVRLVMEDAIVGCANLRKIEINNPDLVFEDNSIVKGSNNYSNERQIIQVSAPDGFVIPSDAYSGKYRFVYRDDVQYEYLAIGMVAIVAIVVAGVMILRRMSS